MLAELEPREFRELWAAALLDGWAGDGVTRRWLGMILAEIRNGFALLRSAHGVEVDADELVSAEDMEPRRRGERRRRATPEAPEPDGCAALEAAMAGRYG